MPNSFIQSLNENLFSQCMQFNNWSFKAHKNKHTQLYHYFIFHQKIIFRVLSLSESEQKKNKLLAMLYFC